MAVEHMAAENNKPTAIKTKTDEYVLKLFWTLSEGQDNARIKASNELVKHLTKKQENSEESKTDELCPTLVYTLERLIKGLSSGRKWSRLGFSLALTQILRNLDVPVKQVLDLTEKHLHFSSHDQKQECGGLMLGQAFVYLSLIQSHRLIKGDGKEYGGEVIKTLLKLCKEKMYLQSICSQGVTLLIQQASSKIFKKRLLPCLQDELIKGWKGCTINRLLIALVSTIHHEDCMEEILEEHWTNPIVSKKSFTFIVEVLRNCSVESKVYLQVCELLAKLSETSVDTTWHGVGARILEGNQQQKQIAGCLLNKLLIVSSSPEQIEELLNRKVREFLILFPGSILVKQSKDEILKTIVDKIRSCQDVDIEMALVRSLLRDPGGPAIDRSTRSQTLSQAIKSLSEEGFDQYFKMVQQIFMEEKVEGFTPTECFRIKKKAVFLLRQKTLIGEHQTALIKQLFVQGYFNIVTPSTKISYCVNKVSYDEEELKMIQNGYLNCVANFHSGSMVQSTHRKKYLQLLIDVFNYAQELMFNTKIVTTKKKLSPKERDAWNKVVVVVKEITDKAEEKKKVEDDAFLFLFIHFALQILTDSIKLDLSLLEDVQSCYKKVFLKKKTGDKNTSDEPEWIEVMTEVLLNMMSHSYQLARVMSSTAFKLLVDHVTPEAVEQIITVMFSKLGDDAVNFIDDEYKDDDDDDDDDDVEDDSGDDEGDDDSDEESSEETDEDLEDTKPNGKKVEKSSKQKKLKTDGKDSKEKSVKSEKVVKKKRGKQEDDDDEMEEAEDFNEGFRQTVKAALGVGAVDSDDEGSDSDLNDSDMEKMDDKLAEAFRSMRKSSRKKAGVEAEKQFLAFRTRVVDLIQILVKSDIQAQIAVILVLPLLRIMDKSNSKEGQRELHVKTKKSFDILYNQKHMKGANEVDKDWLFKNLQEIVQFSKKATDMVLVKEISNACLYIMKLLLLDNETLNPTKRDDTKPKKKKSENYTEKVVDFLKQNLSFFLYNKKEYRFHPGFFNNMLEKFPKLFWFLNVTLLDVLQNERIKVYNKTLACGYMSTLLVKKPCLELKSEEWQKFEDAILPALKKFILSFDAKDNYKPKFLQEIFNILFKMIQISPQVKTKITDDIREKISSLKPKFCKNTRQAFNRYKGVLDEGVGKRSRRQERHSSQDHKPKSVEKINGDTLHVNGDHEAEKIGTATPKSSKKSKKKQKERTDSESDKQNEDDTQVSKMDVEEENNKTEVKKLSKKKRKSDEFALNGELSPSSEKKTKLSKSFNFGVDDGDSTSKKLNKKERKRKISL
ncbi:hypothetical protein SNE40_003971 [Patella caerulea]|uniref:Myb-binding protein 1A n=1 Tax=Patella caerulea TaxID=87958 RepID=A0AAN8KJF9_PATCE